MARWGARRAAWPPTWRAAADVETASLAQTIGTVAAVVLPLWNIPLIVRIQRCRSSKEISLWWAVGVWACLLLMLPSGLMTSDPTYKAFTVVNVVLFSAVVVQVLRYHRR